MSEYITTYTGKHFKPTEPNPELFDIADIAHALSLICRGNGHVKTFWSVGEHCICCAKEAKARGLSDRMVLACLLHDASEWYMSDVPSPFQRELPEYNEREERLQGVTLGMLKPRLFRNIKRLLLMTGACILLVLFVGIFVGLLVALTPFTLFLTIPFIIAFSVPLALLAPIYLFEDITLMEAFKKTFRLGFATWGGVFLVSLLMGIIANVLQGVTMMPWYIATVVKYFFAMSDVGGSGEVTVSAGYSFFLYLMAIIQTFGAYLAMIFTFVGMAYQYGHASEVVDSITVETDIDNFDKL